MKITVRIRGLETPPREWEEAWTDNKTIPEDPEAYAQSMVAQFNRTRKPGEVERELVEVVSVEEFREHTWIKTNLVTLADMTDRYECEVCGIRATAYGMRDLQRDAQFRAKVYEHCHTAQKHLARLANRRERP